MSPAGEPKKKSNCRATTITGKTLTRLRGCCLIDGGFAKGEKGVTERSLGFGATLGANKKEMVIAAEIRRGMDRGLRGE